MVTDLSYANLSSAKLKGTNLSAANLTEARLNGADLSSANLSHAILSGAHLSDAVFGSTILADIDLSQVNELDALKHNGPSSIGIDTLYKSHGRIPDKFLRDLGVPEEVIAHLLQRIRAQ